MAFGLFKKKDTMADSIYYGGKIFTQDPGNPWAEAVACKNGLVIGVGDDESILCLEGGETLMVDLEGEYLFPGLIDPAGHPVMEVFKKCSLPIDSSCSVEQVLEALEKYILLNGSAEAFFAYGFSPEILKGKTLEESALLLDGIESEKPIAILSEGGNSIWLNNTAIEEVKQNSEEDKVANITIPYILYVLAPFDHHLLENECLALAERYKSLGFTSVLSCGEPDYMQGIYQQCLVDMYQWGTHLQRYFGALLINSTLPVKSIIQRLAQKKTNFMELDDNFNYNMLKLIIGKANGEDTISPENLIEICNEAGDNGFDIHIDAFGEDSLISSVNAISKMRSAGYRKNIVVIAHQEDVSAINAKSDNPIDFEGLQIFESVPTILMYSDLISADFMPSFNAFENMEALIDFYTIYAAEKIGFENRLGQICNGYYSDFAVFKTNPFETSPQDFHKLQVTMTVINGLPTKIEKSPL